MLRSIRWTLQGWHAATLSLALLAFGAASYYEVSRARFKEVDAELEGAAQVLAARLHAPPQPQVPPPPGPRDGPPWRPRRGEPGAGPPPARPRPDDPLGLGPGGPPRPGRDPVDDPEGRGPPAEEDPPPPEDGTPPRPPPQREPPPPRRAAPAPRPEPEPELDLPAGFLDRAGEPIGEKPFFIVYRADGAVLKASGNVPDARERPDGAAAGAGAGPPAGSIQRRQSNGIREVVLAGPLGTHVVVGRSVRREQEQLHGLIWLLAGTGAGLLAFGLAGGWLLSRRAVRPIGAMTATAEALSATHLSGRIDAARVPGELAALAGVLNAAFARLESAFLRQARFTADASHELRTPLAVIHSHTELALSRDRSPGEYRQTLATCLKASGRMKGLIDSLLLLARADAGGLDLDVRPFDLRVVAGDSTHLLAAVARETGVGVETDLRPAPLAGDPTRVGQVVTNLVANAIRHNHQGGRVLVSTVADGSDAVLTVADTGPGIAPRDQAHVFERFFRADKARSRKAGGSGLGLAICKSIVEAHGGRITFESESGRGTTFTVRLPRGCREAGRVDPPGSHGDPIRTVVNDGLGVGE